MTAKRRKKNLKQRGGRTAGWGLVHRGCGQKGGSGNAGTGKKGNAKLPRSGEVWTKQLLGKYGFVHHGPVNHDIVINLRDLEDTLPTLIEDKLATESAGTVTMDLTKAGFTKVLSTGKVKHKWKITAQHASPGAIEKIKAAGGELTLAKPNVKASSKPAKPTKAE